MPTCRQLLKKTKRVENTFENIFLSAQYRIRLIYNHVVKGEANPWNRKSICDKILKENVSIIKVEMASKSLTRYGTNLLVSQANFTYVDSVRYE
jgi:hypothetical protein